MEILYCTILARFAWKLDQTLKITYKLKNQMKFLIFTNSPLIIHENDKSLDRSWRRHKRQYKLDILDVFVKN